MRWLSAAASRVHGWFFEPVDARALYLVRVGYGLILAWAYLRYLPHTAELFGPAGFGGHDAMAAFHGWTGTGSGRTEKFRLLHQIGSPALVWGLVVLLIASAFAFAAGFRVRLTGAVALGLHVVFNAHNPDLRGGWSTLLVPYLLYVVIAAPGRALGVDAWLAHKRGEVVSDPFSFVPWSLRLLQVHVCTMYAVAGFERLDHAAWVEGEMVLRAAADGAYGRFATDWMALSGPLRFLTWFAFVLEPAAAVLLWIPRARKYVVGALVAMHLGIEVLTEVGWWSWLMIVSLLVFVPPEWLRWLDRFRPSGGQVASASESA